MKAFNVFGRGAIFFNRDPWRWLGVSETHDYHNLIVSVVVLTFEVGFEWVHGQSHWHKGGHGWELWRNP